MRYKVTQATATGYSTLFGNGRASETLDLTAAATRHDTSTYNSRYTTFNSRYLITYRSPISITCKQLRYGVELDYFGELTMQRLNIQNELINVPLASLGSDGEYHYLFGAPVFKTDRYDFRAYAHEDYYYNNDPDDRHYREKINGGTLTVYNGMYDSTNTQVFSISLDTLGKAEFSIPVNYASFTRGDANVQRVLDLSVESDGDYVESQAVRAYVTGHRRVGNDVATHGGIHLLDVLRDPPGSGSSAYLETGTEYSFSFTYDFKFRFGMEFGLTLGTQASTVIGVYAGVGGGMFSGQNLNISNTTTFSLPVTSSYYSRHEGNYTFRTGERISTSSSQYDVGQDADVYIGLVQNVYFRRMDAVQPIDSLTYAALSARSANGTMGPVYVGAFVLLLAVLCLLVCYRNPLTWGLLVATLLSIMLAWGKNFMGLTDFFIDHVPMYAKFRAVESILVIAEFTIPLMAMLALKEVWQKVEDGTAQERKYIFKAVLVAFALTGGVALLFAVTPTTFFDFYTEAEAKLFGQILPPPASADALLEALSKARQAVFTADCWRSFLIILVGTLMLLAYCMKTKFKAWMLVAGLLVLCLTDLWTVNRRYLNPNDTKQFVKKVERQQVRPMTDADRQILADTSLDYRVLNLAGNVFNENETSYYHKSVGGYHPAKLRRYQELIEYYLSDQLNAVRQALSTTGTDLSVVNGDSIWPVINMLNTKYFLMAQQNIAVQNPYAFGNAWMVDHVSYVDNANDEIDALGKLNLRHEAVADKQFEAVLGQAVAQDSTSTVQMTSYAPNKLTYTVDGKGGVLVLSEIYYPGWTATVDGQEVELGRVNYVLRALHIEAGKHEVVLQVRKKKAN